MNRHKNHMILLIILYSTLMFPLSAAFSKEIAVILTSDLQSNIFSHEAAITDENGDEMNITLGGMDRIASLILHVRKSVDGALAVSSGDDMAGPFFSMFCGIPEILAMGMAGYDVITPGNHEFDNGVDTYINAVQRACPVIVSSNITLHSSDKASRIVRWTVKETAGIKIGIFGLMTPDLHKISSAGAEVEVDSDLVSVSREMVNILRNQQNADIVMAITHIGMDADRRLAESVNGIDIIAGGHSHLYRFEQVENTYNTTWILEAGAGGEKAGIFRFCFENGKIEKTDWQLVTLDRHTGSIPYIRKFVENYRERYEARMSDQIGVSLVNLDARKSVIRTRETNLGDLVADSVARWSENEQEPLALVNSGAIRGDRIYPAGPITYMDVNEIHPFGNSIIRVRLTGEQLIQVMEISASAIRIDEDGCDDENRAASGGFLQVSGMKVEIDMNGTPFCAHYNGRKVTDIISKGSRVRSLKIIRNGEPVDVNPEQAYTLCINSWLASGGDGHYIFPALQHNEDTTVMLTDAIRKWIHDNSPVAIETSGRISISQ